MKMHCISILLSITVVIATSVRDVETLSRILDRYETLNKINKSHLNTNEDELSNVRYRHVKIQLYYESLCPGCKVFHTAILPEVYENLQKDLDVRTYPYGNAKTIIHPLYIEFKCQHGEKECYGNMLHACAIDILNDTGDSIRFNTCLMDVSNSAMGSDDDTVDKCGKKLSVYTEPIKECAKGDKGKKLLKYYGDESHKIKYDYVPFVLINGVEWNKDTDPDFMARVCREFKVTPPACLNKYYYEINDVN